MCVLLSAVRAAAAAAASAAADVLRCALRHRFIQNILFPASAVPGVAEAGLETRMAAELLSR